MPDHRPARSAPLTRTHELPSLPRRNRAIYGLIVVFGCVGQSEIKELTLLPRSGLAVSSATNTVSDDVIADINSAFMIMPVRMEQMANSLPGTEIG